MSLHAVFLVPPLREAPGGALMGRVINAGLRAYRFKGSGTSVSRLAVIGSRAQIDEIISLVGVAPVYEGLEPTCEYCLERLATQEFTVGEARARLCGDCVLADRIGAALTMNTPAQGTP